MSSETEDLRGKLGERRERLARLTRDESAAAQSIEELEHQLASQRRRRELLQRQVTVQEQAIAAVEAALTVLTERLPNEEPLAEEPRKAPGPSPPATEKKRDSVLALRVLREAEEIDLGNVSQRSRDRAEGVRDILGRAEGPLLREEIVKGMLTVEPTEAKARTATDKGLAILVAEGRARCSVPSTEDRWELTPPEKASGNLGTQIQNFSGRTTRWPGELKPGTLIREESGSYESGKRR